MRTMQLTIDGNMEYVDTTVHEVREVLRKYPAAATDTGIFFYEALRERLPWVTQLPEERKIEMRKFCRDVESLRRRRQEQRPSA